MNILRRHRHAEHIPGWIQDIVNEGNMRYYLEQVAELDEIYLTYWDWLVDYSLHNEIKKHASKEEVEDTRSETEDEAVGTVQADNED